MKKYSLFTILSLVMLVLFTSCAEDTTPSLSGDGALSVSYDSEVKTNYTFTSGTSWTISGYDNAELTISPTSGRGGSCTLSINATTANCTNADKTSTFTISSGSGSYAVNKKITVTQPPVFEIETTEYEISAGGGTVTIVFNTDIDLNDVGIMANDAFEDMYDDSYGAKDRTSASIIKACNLIRMNERTSGTTSKTYSYEGTFRIKANDTGSSRIGIIMLCDYNNSDRLTSDYIKISQSSYNSSDYKSTDYSEDGKVYTSHNHTLGSKGFDIIFMGEGFVDKDIADSTYLHAMQEGEEQLFAQEPMASLREYCNVKYVNVVSSQDMSDFSHKTAFSCTFATDGGSEISGDDEAVWNYALKAIDYNAIDNAMIVVLINSTTYGGTTDMYYGEQKSRCGVAQGMSIAYIPLIGGKYESSGITQQMIIQHEVVGHGIGKLADEYSYEKSGTISAEELDTLLLAQDTYKMFLNVTDKSSVAASPWAQLAADATYMGEALDCYQGAYTYTTGLYRPVYDGIMCQGKCFPAPERLLVYKRIMAIANDYNWTYSYETFKDFDLPGRTTYYQDNARRRIKLSNASRLLLPLAHPRIMRHLPTALNTYVHSFH